MFLFVLCHPVITFIYEKVLYSVKELSFLNVCQTETVLFSFYYHRTSLVHYDDVTPGRTHLSLSSLPTSESRLSASRSLSCELTEALLSESPGFSQGGGVGKEGGVRCRRFHGSWWPLLLLLLKCCCALGPSLWPNMELAAVRDSTRGKHSGTQVKCVSRQVAPVWPL